MRIKKYIKKNKILIRNVVILSLLSISLFYTDFNSTIGRVFDILGFVVFIYIAPPTFLVCLKKIDRVNLERDIYCMGMRIFGVLAAMIGLFVFSLGYFVYVSVDGMLITHVLWIIGLSIAFFGAFGLYRSTRRYGVFVYVR